MHYQTIPTKERKKEQSSFKKMKGKWQWTGLSFFGCVCVYVRPLSLTKSTPAHTLSLSSISPSTHPHTHCSRCHFHFLPTVQESPPPADISLRDVSWPPLAHYGKSCSWTCLLPHLCLTARSVSICFHYRMLALGLRLDFPISGGLVENDHHARSREDGVSRHLVTVTVTVHVTFMYRCRHTFYPCAPLYICHVCRSAWLTGPNSARVVISQMLEIICDWWSLYARHTVEKLGLIAPLCQASHFPVLDWLSTSLKYLF